MKTLNNIYETYAQVVLASAVRTLAAEGKIRPQLADMAEKWFFEDYNQAMRIHRAERNLPKWRPFAVIFRAELWESLNDVLGLMDVSNGSGETMMQAWSEALPNLENWKDYSGGLQCHRMSYTGGQTVPLSREQGEVLLSARNILGHLCPASLDRLGRAVTLLMNGQRNCIRACIVPDEDQPSKWRLTSTHKKCVSVILRAREDGGVEAVTPFGNDLLWDWDLEAIAFERQEFVW